MAVTIQIRGDTLANWTTANPVIADREMVLETDTQQFKIGNGVDNYLDLPYGGIAGPSYTDAQARAAAVIDSIADGDTDHAPSRNSVFDALAGKAAVSHSHAAVDITDFTAAAKAAVVIDSIADGDTDHAPSRNSVFDALALKQALNAVLTAWSSFNTNGFLIQTGLATFVGRILAAGSSKISINNPDGASGNPTFDVVEANVNHNNLLNYSANSHIDHSAVSISTPATSGLSGGGDITASRTLALNGSLLTDGDRLDYNDQIDYYDTSVAAQRKLSLYQWLARRGHVTDRVWYWSSDFIIEESSSLSQVGAGTGNSTQSGVYGMDNVERALGVSQTDTGTTATGRRTVATTLNTLTTGLGRLRCGFRLAIEQLSTGGDTFTQYLGFINNSGSGDHNAGAYFRYTHGVNGGRWEAVTASGGGSPTRTAVDTGVAADTLYSIFEVEIAEDTSSAKFYINGVLVATISTNLPPTSTTANFTFGFGWKIEKSVGTTQCNVSVDWAYFELGKSVAR